MDIKDLEKLLVLMKALDGDSKTEESGSIDNPMIGEKVIVRCRDAGVHFGTLVSYSGREVLLKDSRRMWYWKAAEGHTLNACAINGIKDSKISGTVENISLLEACEIIKCTDDGAKSIGESDVYNP